MLFYRLKHGKNSLLNLFGIEPAFVVQFELFTMFNYPVGDAEAFYFCLIIMVGHKLKYSTAEPALNTAVFNRDNFSVVGED